MPWAGSPELLGAGHKIRHTQFYILEKLLESQTFLNQKQGTPHPLVLSWSGEDALRQ